jgi:hypothetical protein
MGRYDCSAPRAGVCTKRSQAHYKLRNPQVMNSLSNHYRYSHLLVIGLILFEICCLAGINSLQITDVSFDRDAPTYDEDISVTVTVRNNGPPLSGTEEFCLACDWQAGTGLWRQFDEPITETFEGGTGSLNYYPTDESAFVAKIGRNKDVRLRVQLKNCSTGAVISTGYSSRFGVVGKTCHLSIKRILTDPVPPLEVGQNADVDVQVENASSVPVGSIDGHVILDCYIVTPAITTNLHDSLESGFILNPGQFATLSFDSYNGFDDAGVYTVLVKMRDELTDIPIDDDYYDVPLSSRPVTSTFKYAMTTTTRTLSSTRLAMVALIDSSASASARQPLAQVFPLILARIR